MAEIGTYASGYKPFTPINAMPSPKDPITWDWMETISQWGQRFNRSMVFGPVILAPLSGTYLLQYGSLNCEYFPPIIKVYDVIGTALSGEHILNYNLYAMGFGSAMFSNDHTTFATLVFVVAN